MIFRYSLTAILCIIFSISANAQTGKIRGQIIDDKSGDPLVGVNVVVKNGNQGAATDIDGKFELALDTGVYALRVSYVSYQKKTIKGVTIKPDEANYLGQIRLKESSDELEEVVVSAERIRNSEQAMLTMKKKSANVIDGISAETIDQTGDGNAAEAIKRVTGVSIQEEKYVYVRGLGDRYTQTTLNGISVPGLDPNRNALQMDIFPTNILSNMIVSKSFSAELPANFTGGLVNIRTKDFPTKKTFRISAGVGYTPSMHFNDSYLAYDGGNTDFLGFDDGTRSLPTKNTDDVPFQAEAIGNPDKAKSFKTILKNFNKNMAAKRNTSFMDVSLGLSAGNQMKRNDLKIGYNVALSYENTTTFYNEVEYNFYGKPDDRSKYELEARELQQGSLGKNNVVLAGLGGLAIKSQKSRYSLDVLHLQNGESSAGLYNYTGANQGANFQAKQHNLEYEQRSLTNALLNGIHSFNREAWEIEWKLSPTLSIVKSPDTRYSRIRTDGPGYSIGSEAGIPKRIWRDLHEMNYQGKVDVTRSYTFFNDTEAKFKFGGSYTYKQRDYEIKAFDIVPQSGVDITGTNPDQILKDENLWGKENPNGTIYSPNFIPNNPNKYSSNSNRASLYASNEFVPFTNMTATLGLRAEQYTQRYTGYDPVNNKELDNEKVLDAIDLFPAVNLNYAILEGQSVRFSYSRTIARPSFKEASKATIFDPITGRTYIGGLIPDQNAEGETIWGGDLKETRINNFDLRWEWFHNRGQMISISGFYKQFHNPIEIVQFVKAKNNVQPRNVGDARAMGVEVELRQSLGYLTDALAPLSVNANVTYTKSSVDIAANELESRRESAREGEEVEETRAMAGQSPYIINAGLSYKGKENGIEAGLYYNVQGKTLQIVGVNDRPDVYSDPFHSLNVTASKTLGKEDRLSIGIKADNILNDDKLEYFDAYKADNKVFSKLSPGRSFSVSFGYKF